MRKFYFLPFIFCLPFIALNQEKEERERKDTTKINYKNNVIIIIQDSTSNGAKEKSPTHNVEVNLFRGLTFGVNGYFTDSDFGINNDPDNMHMELNYGRSFFLQFNIAEYNVPIFVEQFRFHTGLGFRFNRYAFKSSTTTIGFNDSTIFANEVPNADFNKNFLNVTYISLPVMLSLVPGKNPNKGFHISTGANLNYRIGSRTKQVYRSNDGKGKNIKKGHYHINPFLIDATFKMGIDDFSVTANYGLTPLFEKTKGPEYYPFSLGVSWFF